MATLNKYESTILRRKHLYEGIYPILKKYDPTPITVTRLTPLRFD